MADITAQELDPQELATLARIEKDNTALAALIDDLGSSSRRTRQFSARVAALLAQREPELLAPYISEMIDALYRPEAQTRWEILDALTVLVPEHAKEIGAAYEGAETALFDELSATLGSRHSRCSARGVPLSAAAPRRCGRSSTRPSSAITATLSTVICSAACMFSPRARSRAVLPGNSPPACSSTRRTARAAISRRARPRSTTCWSSGSSSMRPRRRASRRTMSTREE